MVFGISKDIFELGKRMIREESNLGREKFATLEEDRGNNFNLDSSINGSRQCSKQWPRNRPTSRNLWQLGHLIRLVSRWLSLRTCHSRDNYRFAYEIPRNFTRVELFSTNWNLHDITMISQIVLLKSFNCNFYAM